MVVAGASTLIGCTQLQTHDSLADIIKGRSGTGTSDKSAQDSNTVPREVSGRNPAPPYVIEPPDELAIEVTVKDPKTGAAVPLPEQPITGRFLVRADGTVGLGKWGTVKVSGLKLDDASDAVRKHLANSQLTSATERDLAVVVDVAARNSKKYYVLADSPEGSQKVYAFPATWQETVSDAIASVDGLAATAAQKSIRIVRKKANGGPDEVLTVDWIAITQNNVATTNYQIQPGDRVIVANK